MVEALQSASYYLTVHCLKEFSGIVNAVLIINNHPGAIIAISLRNCKNLCHCIGRDEKQRTLQIFKIIQPVIFLEEYFIFLDSNSEISEVFACACSFGAISQRCY